MLDKFTVEGRSEQRGSDLNCPGRLMPGIFAGVVSEGADEGSALDEPVGATGTVWSTAEVGAPLSAELTRDKLYSLLPVSVGFASGSDCSLVDSGE